MPPLEDDLPVTELLQRYGAGDRDAGEVLAEIVYRSLHDRAQRLIQEEGPSHTLHATGLVHEAWLRLGAGDEDSDFEDRGHFLRLAGRVMRNVLVDHARKKRAQKRGAGAKAADIEELELALSSDGDPVEVIALHEALEKLSAKDPELAEVVELRFFGGLTFEEVGKALGSSAAGAHRAWQLAQAWLLRELE